MNPLFNQPGSRCQSSVPIMNPELHFFSPSGIIFAEQQEAAFVTSVSSRCSLLDFREHPESVAPHSAPAEAVANWYQLSSMCCLCLLLHLSVCIRVDYATQYFILFIRTLGAIFCVCFMR